MVALNIEGDKRETFEQSAELENLNQYCREQITHQPANLKKQEDIKGEIDNKSANNPLWSMNFDGSCTKRNAGAGVWLHNTGNNYVESHAFKLDLKCTNNIAEYEALLLGLNLLKKIGAKRIVVHGDSELVIKQINGE